MRRVFLPLLSLLALFVSSSVLLASSNSWTSLGPDGGCLAGVATVRARPGRAYAYGVGGCFRSADAGTTWAPAASGLERTALRCLAVAPSDPNRVYAGSSTGFHVSTDGGERWAPAVAVWRFPDGAASAVSGVTVDPKDAQLVYVTLPNEMLFRSTDGGTTWLRLDRSVAGTSGLIQDPRGDSLFAYSQSTGYGRSTDHGMTWSTQSTDALRPYFLFAPNRTPGYVYAGKSDSVLYRSTDDLRTWTPVHSFPAWPSHMAGADDGTLFLAQGSKSLFGVNAR